MKRLYLGDSFDAVKRMWQEVMLEWAPLFADPRFVPTELRSEFTTMTRIPILGAKRPLAYSILNDPDTGIFAPDRANQRSGLSHASLAMIREQLSDSAVRCVVTFDQSNHRKRTFSAEDQRAAKLAWLREKGVTAFYYVSHAPFMFACASKANLEKVVEMLEQEGIPKTRLQRCA